MGRTGFASENALLYLEHFAKHQQCVMGLILGQISSIQDDINIVHLAKTREEKFEAVLQDDIPESEAESELNLKTVSESWVADHAKHVTRMLPGGMFVLGIFVVSPEDIFSDTSIVSKLKSILTLINKTVSANKYMNGSPEECSERLVIHMSHNKKVTSKIIEIGQAAFFKPLEINFNSRTNWLQLECYYEFDELYPVVVKNTGISVKEQFQEILEAAHRSIESSIVILDGKLRDSSDKLESQFKKIKTKSGNKANRDEEIQTVQVSILVPCESKIPDAVEYMECEGTTHFSGIVASRIFLNTKASIGQAITAVKQDIIRSLAARFTMHCDALIDDSLLPEEKVCFNEPPRRVYIRLPEAGDGKVFLCDYLFPGESPVEALVSVKDMLDANITQEDVICNVETPADTSEFDALEKEPSSEEILTAPQDGKQTLLPMGLGVAVLVLLIAVISYYYVTIPSTPSS